MTVFFIMVPLMVVAIAIAAGLVLYCTVREPNITRYGSHPKPKLDKPLYSIRKVGTAEELVAEPYTTAS
jgi:hypothetical protein